ncbi:hypothetical protein M0813_02112 [Anaeramoeba flamelloides]|uniref:GOST seven transmembrane domain-containing protein n=1 Tax=Anaeramoeba flamelloides TaxID=1746091 RepID=A0ABQ8YQG7_9EUKA|nr:hypothetical protein M0813_02112 [Anaeramoeba flamelloides]
MFIKNKLVLLLVLTFVVSTNCLIFKDLKITTNTEAFLLDTFGFQKGGSSTMKIKMNKNRNDFWYLDCLENQYKGLVLEEDTKICSDLTKNKTLCLVQQEFNPDIDIKRKAQKEDYEYFLVINCGKKEEITFTLDYTFVNPDGQYLSLGQIPYPYLYLVFGSVWCLLLIIWFVNWYTHRDQQIKLHRLLTVILIAKIVKLFFYYTEWNYLSKKGMDNYALLIARATYTCIFDFIFYTTLLMIASGWSIIKPRLSFKEHLRIGLPVLSLILSKELQLYFELSWFGFILLIILAFSYFYILRFVFEYTNYNIRSLQFQLLMIRDAGIRPITTPIYSKYQLFRKYKTSLFYYICLSILVYGLSIVIVRYRWIIGMCSLIVDLILYIGIGFTFCLRNYNELFDDPPPLEEPVNRTNDGYEQLKSDYDDNNLETWVQGMPLPRVERSDEELLPESVVYIENVGKKNKVDLGHEVPQEKK